MTPLQAFVLGVVQGLTEFLPVSSSAHLVLVPWLLGWTFAPGPAFVFDVLVQLGTLAAVVAYYARDLVGMARAALRGLLTGRPFDDPQARLAWLLLAASLPAALAGVLLKSQVEQAFGSPRAVGAFLLCTAGLLLASERLGRRARAAVSLRLADALWIGAAQALSLFPGVSRSGATIAGGLTRGLTRPEAARFSFLMAVPVMLGAGALTALDLLAAPDALAQIPPLAIGFLTAAVVGYLAIHWLLSYLARRPLTGFAVYCLIVGAGALLLGALRG